jgi:iron(III) transport system permease protein
METNKLTRSMKKETNGWLIAAVLGAAVILLPIGYIFISLFRKPNDNWMHIKEYLLKDYILGSLQLVLFAGGLSVLVGVTLAWLVAAYDFPMKRFFRWALAGPLAIPPYIAAYTYSNMLSYTGIVQSTLRNQWDIRPSQVWFDIMSMQGAVFIFTMFLYPYVYLITYAFLERQSSSYIENARLLGRGPLAVFFRIVVPISRPAIAGGLGLVAFEVLSDYGVASHFGLQTISVAIFQTWFGMYDVESAMRLAAWLMVGVVGLFLLERLLRRSRSFHASTGKTRPLMPQRMSGLKAAAAVVLCSGVLAVSFVIPVVQMLQWAVWSYEEVFSPAFLQLVWNTVKVAGLATIIVLILSVITANVARMQRSTLTYILSRGITAGYSIPGAIIAIGVLAVFIAMDALLSPWYGIMGWGEGRLILSMSIVMMVVAYIIRFMATGFNAVEAGFERVGNRYAEASRMLGHGMTRTFFKVDLHLIRGALGTGFVLTFVEIVKELPLALLLRPFNFETLATKTYQYASDEKIIEASIPSLFIISISLISVFLITQTGRKAES